MESDHLASIWEKSIQLMAEGYTCAESALRVLLEEIGCDDGSCQWSTAGYMGAIKSGKTICGCLFGATVFLGYFHRLSTSQLPEVDDEKRTQAIASVEQLYLGFIEQFGDTDCYKLSGCDWSIRKDIVRYLKDEVYTDTCYKYMRYVLAQCMEQVTGYNE